MSKLSLFNKIPLSIREKTIYIVPKVFRPLLPIIPFTVKESLLLKILNTIFNEAISEGDFNCLENKWLKISVTDLELNWWLSVKNKQLIVSTKQISHKEDVSFSAKGGDLLLIAGRKQDPDTLFFQRRLSIEGDTELGLEVKNLIDAIELEQLPCSLHKIVTNFANLLQQTYDDIGYYQQVKSR